MIGFQMLLEVQERLALMELLPREGDYAAIKELRKAREIINFTPDENKLLKFEQRGEGILVWDVAEGAKMLRDIPVSEWATNQIRQVLINQSNEKTLTESHFSLYEKFVIHFE